MQGICVWLMQKNRKFQGSQILNSSNEVAAGIYQAAANTKEYFDLRGENERLAEENTRLRNRLKSNYNIIPLTVFEKNDTLYMQHYSYINAKVVNSSINKRRNYLTINIGKSQGAGRDMAVMSVQGIVGYITDVSENFSSAMSLLHKDSKINCQLKNDGSYGILIWDGTDYQHCYLTDIPTHAKLKRGDTIVTSELSGIFPEGLYVGTVEKWEQKQNESFFTVKIKLGADLKKVNHVYIIQNKYKGERDSLERNSQKQIDD